MYDSFTVTYIQINSVNECNGNLP